MKNVLIKEAMFWGKGLMLLVFSFSVGPQVRAEATKEILSDKGFYTPSMNVEIWNPETRNPNRVNFEYTGLGSSPQPEGQKVIRTNALREQWMAWAIINTASPGSTTAVPRNFSDYAGGAIRFWLKSNRRLLLKIRFDDGTPDPQLWIPSTNNQWMPIVKHLEEFNVDENRLRRVTHPFLIIDDENIGVERTWYIDHIRWTKPLDDLIITPSSVDMERNQNQRRQFTAIGHDSRNEEVIVYPIWSSNRGSISPNRPSRSVVFTAESNSDGDIDAEIEGESASARIDMQNDVPDEQFGLLSESIQGMVLGGEDQNSDMLLYSEDDSPNPDLALAPRVRAILSGSPEGQAHHEVLFKRKTSGSQFQGVAFSWGVGNADANDIRDVNQYYEGSLRFWFNSGVASSQVENKLMVGIRSLNVEPGNELSSVLLSDYVPFDGNWHAVVIPFEDLAGAAPFADLSRMKVFANFSIAGSLSTTSDALRTVLIDHLRWDTNTPGSLDSIEIQSAGDPSDLPRGSYNLFTAVGRDTDGNSIDVYPTWDFQGASAGTFSTTEGPQTFLKAVETSRGGTVRARAGTHVGSLNVSVTNVAFPESYNVFSDGGLTGVSIVSIFPENNSTRIVTSGNNGNGAPGDNDGYLDVVLSLQDDSDGDPAFAVWSVIHQGVGRYLQNFAEGYLQFYVRSQHDLEVSILSDDVDEDNNNAKITLSDLGVPFSQPGSGTWQKVLIPLAVFEQRQPDHNFRDMVAFFSIGATTPLIGERSDVEFDVDNVKWLTRQETEADLDSVVQGLKNKQLNNGLLRSFSDDRAVTYDQALAAMAFTLTGNEANAKEIFDRYQLLYEEGNGFFNEYHIGDLDAFNLDIVVGPNVFMALALIHYQEVAESNDYDELIDGLVQWIRGFQDDDGAIQFGNPLNPGEASIKSTEHNFDAYALFLKYAELRDDDTYRSDASQILNWLDNEAWNAQEDRFNVGEIQNGDPDEDQALDAYTLAVMSVLGDSARPIGPLLSAAESDFGITKINHTTGRSVDGVDFGGPLDTPLEPDAVWFEGMGQMAVAYDVLGNNTKRNDFIREIEKAVFPTSQSGAQGIAYASNNGTAFGGGLMNDWDPSIAAMAWYVFSKLGFNPFLKEGPSGINLAPSVEIGPDQIDLVLSSHGDGDVDGDDFLIWQAGFGGNINVGRADADRDRDVDGDDFLIWQAEFDDPLAELRADFDGSGFVDGDDFLIWQADFGETNITHYNPLADIDNDGDVDGDDFLLWQAAFGSIVGESSYNANADMDGPGGLVGFISEAVVQDDNLPNPPGELFIEWRQLSGPSSVQIIDVNDPNTRFVFTEAGFYEFQLTVDDSQLQDRDEVVVIVSEASGGGGGSSSQPRASNGQGVINEDDVKMLIKAFETSDSNFDLTGDGEINHLDLALMMDHYGTKVGESNWNSALDISQAGNPEAQPLIANGVDAGPDQSVALVKYERGGVATAKLSPTLNLKRENSALTSMWYLSKCETETCEESYSLFQKTGSNEGLAHMSLGGAYTFSLVAIDDQIHVDQVQVTVNGRPDSASGRDPESPVALPGQRGPIGLSMVPSLVNPKEGPATITLSLSEPTDVKIMVLSPLHGTVKHLGSGFYPKGKNRVVFDAVGLGVGTHMLTVETDQGRKTLKFVVTK